MKIMHEGALAKVEFPDLSLPAVRLMLKHMDVPIVNGEISTRVFKAAMAIPKKIDWRGPALLDDLSPAAGLGAVKRCLKLQLKDRARVVSHAHTNEKHLVLGAPTKVKGYPNQSRVHLYAKERLGKEKEYARFLVKGFLKPGAPNYYLLIGLHEDDPFAWVVSTSHLIDQWDLIGGQAYYQRAPSELFRVPHKEWENRNGCLDICLRLNNKRYILDAPGKVGL